MGSVRFHLVTTSYFSAIGNDYTSRRCHDDCNPAIVLDGILDAEVTMDAVCLRRFSVLLLEGVLCARHAGLPASCTSVITDI